METPDHRALSDLPKRKTPAKLRSEQTVHNWKKLFLDSGRDGPAMKSAAVARWFAHRAHFTHVRTRHRSPHTNGVIERWFEALKYERLYREDIADGIDLA